MRILVTPNFRKLISSTLASAFALAVGLTAPSAARADNLDRELRVRAPKIIAFLKKKDYRNVGVLKFLVKKGSEAASDNIGPLNTSMADRLEIALVLANPNEDLGIIQRASQALVEAGNRRANHLTAEGRKALFDGRYPLAWGNKEVPADAFVAGLVTLSPDLMKTTVTLEAIGNEGGEPEKVDEFSVSTDVRTLVESGESFLRRGAFDDEDRAGLVAAADAAKVKRQEEKHPLQTSPVSVKVLYDGKLVAVTFTDGKATIPEPDEGQEVSLVLENKGNERYGVVLRCNGLNTLFKEQTDAARSHKWILEPGERIPINGYQMNDGTVAKFRVLSLEETKAKEINYGREVGTLNLVIFRERKEGDKDAPQPNEPPETLVASRAIGKGEFPTMRPGSLKALQGQLRKQVEKEDPNATGRNLIGAGKEIKGEIKRVEFRAESLPLLSATILYRRQ